MQNQKTWSYITQTFKTFLILTDNDYENKFFLAPQKVANKKQYLKKTLNDFENISGLNQFDFFENYLVFIPILTTKNAKFEKDESYINLYHYLFNYGNIYFEMYTNLDLDDWEIELIKKMLNESKTIEQRNKQRKKVTKEKVIKKKEKR